MHVKKWAFLPFEGGNSHPDEHTQQTRDANRSQRRRLGLLKKGKSHSSQPTGDDAELTKHESAAAFAAKDEAEIIQDYNSPTRWWVASTLFPLIAGTFGPMASAFNICAVAIEWRLIVAGNSQEAEGHPLPDPRWLVAVNGVSLAIAIISNLALLGHMTGRIRFNVSAPTVILGWYVSGFILIGLVAAAPSKVPLPADPKAAYSQAYYYACFAGAIYILLSMMLTVTAYGIWIGHYGEQFKLSLSQRSLMLQTMLFLGYVLCAAGVYQKIENWIYLDAVYYVVVTLFTIGFGDLTPMTHLGRSLYFPMSVGGIVFVGLIIANIRTLVGESASVKVSTRLVEKARFTALKSGDPANGVVKIRGFMKRDTKADTELERREKEFDIMREIQKTATRNNRIFVLTMALTAFMILWFVGAAAFWKAEGGTGGQSWSYFQALYFTYTAQLTIGYGDFEPQTNAGKPTFVFWALIALPTLTVLIGAVGDALAEFVNWATEWIGKHAPALLAFLLNALRRDVDTKDAIKKTFRKAERAESQQLDDNLEVEHGFDSIATIERGHVVPTKDALTPAHTNAFENLSSAATEEAYLPFVILQAARRVLDHMDDDPPRKYTFAEWTWLLKLVGEDESTEEGHRVIGQNLPGHVEVKTPLRSEGQSWSWMGQESPLMDLRDDGEPKWVLRRLMEKLEGTLRKAGEKEIDRRLENSQDDRETGQREKNDDDVISSSEDRSR